MYKFFYEFYIQENEEFIFKKHNQDEKIYPIFQLIFQFLEKFKLNSLPTSNLFCKFFPKAKNINMNLKNILKNKKK